MTQLGITRQETLVPYYHRTCLEGMGKTMIKHLLGATDFRTWILSRGFLNRQNMRAKYLTASFDPFDLIRY